MTFYNALEMLADIQERINALTGDFNRLCAALQGEIVQGISQDPINANKLPVSAMDAFVGITEATEAFFGECGDLFRTTGDEAPQESRKKQQHYAPKDNRRNFVTCQRVKVETGCDLKTLKEAIKRTRTATMYPYEGSRQKHVMRYQVPALKAEIYRLMSNR